MIKINNDQDYKKVIARLKQLSENTNIQSIFLSSEIDDLRKTAIAYEYERYDLTAIENNHQQLSATG